MEGEVEALNADPSPIESVTVPAIIEMGGAEYAKLGVENSTGTRVFSLSGNVVRPGNYELELGTPMRELVFDIAGGVPDGRQLLDARHPAQGFGAPPASHRAAGASGLNDHVTRVACAAAEVAQRLSIYDHPCSQSRANSHAQEATRAPSATVIVLGQRVRGQIVVDHNGQSEVILHKPS
jgi:hypothetical protein